MEETDIITCLKKRNKDYIKFKIFSRKKFKIKKFDFFSFHNIENETKIFKFW